MGFFRMVTRGQEEPDRLSLTIRRLVETNGLREAWAQEEAGVSLLAWLGRVLEGVEALEQGRLVPDLLTVHAMAIGLTHIVDRQRFHLEGALLDQVVDVFGEALRGWNRLGECAYGDSFNHA